MKNMHRDQSPEDGALLWQGIEIATQSLSTPASTPAIKEYEREKCGYADQYKALAKPTCGCRVCGEKWANRSLLRLPALSIRQPWAWLIIHGGKDIENRSWATRFRGEFLIHAAKTFGREERETCEAFREDGIGLPSQLQAGGIIGKARIVDCVSESGSKWFEGPWGFVITGVTPLNFYPCKGALGFFRVKP